MASGRGLEACQASCLGKLLVVSVPSPGAGFRVLMPGRRVEEQRQQPEGVRERDPWEGRATRGEPVFGVRLPGARAWVLLAASGSRSSCQMTLLCPRRPAAALAGYSLTDAMIEADVDPGRKQGMAGDTPLPLREAGWGQWSS